MGGSRTIRGVPQGFEGFQKDFGAPERFGDSPGTISVPRAENPRFPPRERRARFLLLLFLLLLLFFFLFLFLLLLPLPGLLPPIEPGLGRAHPITGENRTLLPPKGPKTSQKSLKTPLGVFYLSGFFTFIFFLVCSIPSGLSCSLQAKKKFPKSLKIRVFKVFFPVFSIPSGFSCSLLLSRNKNNP